MIYLSHATTIGIDEAAMGAGYVAHWLDPATGATIPATAGPSYTSPGKNSAGGPDWVLVLQAPAQAAAPAPAPSAGLLLATGII